MSKIYLVYASGCNKVIPQIIYVADSHESAYSYIKDNVKYGIIDRTYVERTDKNEDDDISDDEYYNKMIYFEHDDYKAYQVHHDDWENLYVGCTGGHGTDILVFGISPNTYLSDIAVLIFKRVQYG